MPPSPANARATSQYHGLSEVMAPSLSDECEEEGTHNQRFCWNPAVDYREPKSPEKKRSKSIILSLSPQSNLCATGIVHRFGFFVTVGYPHRWTGGFLPQPTSRPILCCGGKDGRALNPCGGSGDLSAPERSKSRVPTRPSPIKNKYCCGLWLCEYDFWSLSKRPNMVNSLQLVTVPSIYAEKKRAFMQCCSFFPPREK